MCIPTKKNRSKQKKTKVTKGKPKPKEPCPLAKPVIDLEGDAVAVKGDRLNMQLMADRPYSGRGTFDCTEGGDKVKFYCNGEEIETPHDFTGDSAVTIEVEAQNNSDLDGVVVTWKLSGKKADTKKTATKTITAVKATLDVFKKSGAKLTALEKKGDGRVIHLQNGTNDRSRAKVVLNCLPADWDGSVKLGAIKGNIALYDADKNGTLVDLSNPLPVGPGKRTEFYVQGTTVSSGKTDTGLTLKIPGLSNVVDTAKMTVVETKIQIYEPRGPDHKVDLVVIAEDKKLNPGRLMYKQGARFPVMRAKMVLYKTPIDAPCKLLLKSAASAKVNFFPAGGTKAGTDMSTMTPKTTEYTHEHHVDGETAVPFTKTVAADEIKDVAKGLLFWVEGKDVSTDREVEVTVDVEEVEDKCDAVSFTVKKPTLTLEVKRTDGTALQDAIDYTITAMNATSATATGTIDKATGTATVDIDAGFYLVKLAPKNVDEKKMRMNRTEPPPDDAAIAVVKPATAKYELAPPYKKVQFIGYFITTGAYIGTDDPSTALGSSQAEREENAWNTDITGRCGLMKDAIEKAGLNGHVDTSADVLKIFMAPEFFFRGTQGAYPMEKISEIMRVSDLKNEMAKTAYNDWLFVLGSAIGSMGRTKQRATHAGNVDSVTGPDSVFVTCKGGAAGVKKDWKFWVTSPGNKWPPDVGSAEYTIDKAAEYNTSAKNFRLDFRSRVTVPKDRPIGVWPEPYPVDRPFPDKLMNGNLKCVGYVPVAGNTFELGPVTVKIIQPAPSGGTDEYTVGLVVDADKTIAPGAGNVVESGGTKHAANLLAVNANANLLVEFPTASPASGAAAGWDLLIADGSGNFSRTATACYKITNVQNRPASSSTRTSKQLRLTGNPTIPVGRQVALSHTGPVQVGLSEPTKTVWIEATIVGATPVAGWAIEQGAVKGAVVNAVDNGGGNFDVLIALPAEKSLATGPITFVDPGEVEIINVALVNKGGAAAPTGADGRALKELLVYKEEISSVDFQSIDYGGQFFYRDVRRLIEIQGDSTRRAFQTEGSEGTTGENLPGTVTTKGQRISEVSLSGIGGGTVFTMDGITFGLEVCLDHGANRLKKYYASNAKSGEPRVQVQLIPSCGMSIDTNGICYVSGGLVFNVDAKHVAAKKGSGASSNIKKLDSGLIAPTPATASQYMNTAGPGGTGYIYVYEPENTPAPRKV